MDLDKTEEQNGKIGSRNKDTVSKSFHREPRKREVFMSLRSLWIVATSLLSKHCQVMFSI
jgi:hypothetical protein